MTWQMLGTGEEEPGTEKNGGEASTLRTLELLLISMMQSMLS
jgi:hypothetical protein